jgi:UDP:flavonoid glycosyltransferase YjiC (YdhE family)
MATVLFTSFGSAGDLFPLIPVAKAVAARGHRPVMVVPRSLGGLLRGTDLRDPDLLSTRRDGWDSWEYLLDRWVAPSLPLEVQAYERTFDDVGPDLVVSSALAIGARIAARRQDRATALVNIFPQWVTPPRGSAPRTREAVARLVGDDAEDLVHGVLWGGLETELLLYDGKLLDDWHPGRDGVELVGFPYWDGGADPLAPGPAGAGPRVLVSFGSFLGRLAADQLRRVVDALSALPVEVIVAGTSSSDAATSQPGGPRVRYVGFTPVSDLLPACCAVVHHGGIGSTFAALGRGLPALVVPQAFDQPFNARMVAGRGVGIDARSCTIDEGVATLVADDTARDAARALAGDLVPGDVAATAAADTLCAAL